MKPGIPQASYTDKRIVRSPCPGLNALANHGYINRNGRNLTIPHLITGLQTGMNVGADFTTAIGTAGLLSSPDPLEGFSLPDLDEHNFPIEHDASLSRGDAYFGNDYSFNSTYWDMVLSHYAGVTKTSIAVASKAKYSRVQNSMAINPTFTYGPREFILSYGETALYLQTMSDPYSGVANLSFVKSLFEEERLPFLLGWKPSTQPITLATLGQMILELYNANPEKLPEGLNVTTMAYKDALEGINPVTGLLGNISSAL